jgi:hypothetical protein
MLKNGGQIGRETLGLETANRGRVHSCGWLVQKAYICINRYIDVEVISHT